MYGFSTGQGAPVKSLHRFSTEWNMDDVELMQYTGINDSKRTEEFPKGQKIFEGDILKKENKVFVVKWGLGEPSFFALTKETHSNCYSVSGLASHGAIVIGNIYQNPELLSTKL